MRFAFKTEFYFGMLVALFMLVKAEDNLSTDNEIIESPVYIPTAEEVLHEKRFELRRVSVQNLDFTTEDTILDFRQHSNKMVHDDGFFCDLVPRRISRVFCRFGFFFEMICPDNCEVDQDRCEDECAADDGKFKCKKLSCRGCTFCEPTTAPTGPTPSPTERCREDCADFDGPVRCKRPTCQGCDSCNIQPTTAPTGPTPSPTEQCREDCADFDGRLKCKRPTCQGCDSCNAYFSAN